MSNPLIKKTLNFPESFFQGKLITERELEFGRIFITKIFNKKEDYKVKDSNDWYGQLIKVAALVNRYPRCLNALDYIMEGFQDYIHPIWKPSYNLIFSGPSFGGVLGQDPLEVMAQIKYNHKHYENLNTEEKQICNDLNVHIMEIHCLIKLIAQNLNKGLKPSIVDIYNLFDKFEYLFNNLFGFHITHTQYNQSLIIYRKVRNAIAHSNFILHQETIKLVEWSKLHHVIGIIELNFEELIDEMIILCTIICQVIALYQLMQQ